MATKKPTKPAQPTQPQPPEEPMTYEQARAGLVEVVQQLESGGVGLAESMTLWERGEKLATICQEWLDGAKARIQEAQAKVTDSEPPSDPGESPSQT